MLKWSHADYVLKQSALDFSWEIVVKFILSCPFPPDTEDASETDLAKHDEDDYVEIKEQ